MREQTLFADNNLYWWAKNIRKAIGLAAQDQRRAYGDDLSGPVAGA